MSDKQIILVEQHLVEAAKQVTAELMLTPAGQFLSIQEGEPAAHALELMSNHHFDQLPVVQGDRIVGLIRRWVPAMPPSGTVGDFGFESLETCGVAQSSSIPILVECLKQRASVLVVGSEGKVVGLLHFADLNRQPMRVFLYLHLSALEMGLAELLRRRHPQVRAPVASGAPGSVVPLLETAPGWLGHLPEHKQANVLGRFALDRHRNIETEYIEGLELSDLLAIIKSDPVLLEAMGYINNKTKEFNSELAPLIALRNCAMHPVRTVIREMSDVAKLAENLDRMDRLLTRVQQALAGWKSP